MTDTKFENCTFDNGGGSPEREQTQLALAQALKMNAKAAYQLAVSLGAGSPIGVVVNNTTYSSKGPEQEDEV